MLRVDYLRTVGRLKQSAQSVFTVEERHWPNIFPIKPKQVERVEDGLAFAIEQVV